MMTAAEAKKELIDYLEDVRNLVLGEDSLENHLKIEFCFNTWEEVITEIVVRANPKANSNSNIDYTDVVRGLKDFFAYFIAMLEWIYKYTDTDKLIWFTGIGADGPICVCCKSRLTNTNTEYIWRIDTDYSGKINVLIINCTTDATILKGEFDEDKVGEVLNNLRTAL